MQGNLFTINVNGNGQLAADVVYRFALPVGATLIGGSAICDADDSFLLNFGTTADADAYIDDLTVTGSATACTDIAPSSLVDGAPMHIAAGTDLIVTIDYDGGAGDDAANAAVCLVFREG
jgi:hypothetical protein